MAEFISKLFSVKHKLKDELNQEHLVKKVKFSFYDSFTHMKQCLMEVICCKCFKDERSYLSENNMLFKIGYEHADRQLDII